MKNSAQNSTSNNGHHSLLRELNRTPPFYVYYSAGLGKGKGAHPRIEGIAKISGLSTATVERLSQKMDWEDVTLGTMQRFCLACSVYFLHIDSVNRRFLVLPNKRYLKWLAKGKTLHPFRHLSSRQLRNFNARCEEWAKSLTPRNAPC